MNSGVLNLFWERERTTKTRHKIGRSYHRNRLFQILDDELKTAADFLLRHGANPTNFLKNVRDHELESALK